MTDLRRAAEMALEALEELRFASAPFLDEAMEALRTALAQPEQDLAYQEAKLLAQNLYKRHYQHDKHYVSGHVVWKPLDTTVGVITQIDNMVSGLVRPQPEQECVYPQCETAGGCDGPCGAAVKQEPVAWGNGAEWESLAWHLCAEEHGEEACAELLYDGGPIPTPWGERWLKYEEEAKRMIALVRRHTAPVDTVNTSQEPVDETAKCGHEPVVGTKTWVEDGKVFTQNLYASDIYITPPKRWVGLTDQEIEDLWNQHEFRFDYYSFSCDIEAKLKEKNFG